MDLKVITNELNKFFQLKLEVINYINPEDIASKFDFKVGEKKDNIEEDLKNVIKYSVHTNSLTFFNQLFTGSDIYGVLSELIIALLNTSMYTYEMSPIFTFMEKYVFEKVLGVFGFEGGDVIMCPGGSMSNMNAIHLARYNLDKTINKKGLYSRRNLKIFCSTHSHYSFKKGASFMGLGYDSIVYVDTNSDGEMDIKDLEEKMARVINRYDCMLMVVATAGTTVFGAFDPIYKIRSVCDKYNVWLHVDGSWGGSLILSDKHKYKLNGIHLADSVTWNPHKMLQVPLQCSLLLTKHNDIFTKCNSYHASYLFQSDKFYNSDYDSGDKYIQCGRRVDILKLWVRWKVDGDSGLEKRVNTLIETALNFKLMIKLNDCFELLAKIAIIPNLRK